MARKKKPLPLLEKILITDVAAEGKALAKVDGLAVFVPYVVPGDVVDLQIRRKKHSYAEAEAVHIHKYAEERAKTFLPTLWRVRRMQVANLALRGTVALQTEAGDGSPRTNRQD